MLPLPIITALGLIAGALTTAAFVPQVVRIWKRRSASDISGFGVTMLTIGVALWMIYGIETHSLPIILANAVTLALNVSILALKIRHRP
jgi:MtN3 and saliva related transmembrane protein